MNKQTKQTKIISNDNDRYDYVMGEPYIKDIDGTGYFTGENLTFRIQGVDLKNFAYQVWVTNGVYCDMVLIHFPYFKEFMQNEKINGTLFIDDSGIFEEEFYNKIQREVIE